MKVTKEKIYLRVPVAIYFQTPAGRKEAIKQACDMQVEFGGAGTDTGVYGGKSQLPVLMDDPIPAPKRTTPKPGRKVTREEARKEINAKHGKLFAKLAGKTQP